MWQFVPNSCFQESKFARVGAAAIGEFAAPFAGEGEGVNARLEFRRGVVGAQFALPETELTLAFGSPGEVFAAQRNGCESLLVLVVSLGHAGP